jgi:hypothetical protein
MHIAVVGQQHLQQQRQQAGSGGIPVAGAACEQADGLAHGGNVGRDVDGVGHQQQLTMAYSSGRGRWRRILVASPAADAAYARADGLYAHHQRQGQDHGPQHLQAELGTGLRIGGDAAGVIVGRARDQAGAQFAEPATGGLSLRSVGLRAVLRCGRRWRRLSVGRGRLGHRASVRRSGSAY